MLSSTWKQQGPIKNGTMYLSLLYPLWHEVLQRKATTLRVRPQQQCYACFVMFTNVHDDNLIILVVTYIICIYISKPPQEMHRILKKINFKFISLQHST